MDFPLTDDQKMIRDALKKFADAELAPRAADWDRSGEFPLEQYRKCGELGFLGMGFPEEYGGTPADLTARAISHMEFSRACAGFSLSVGASMLLFGSNVLNLGSAAQKKKYLPPLLCGEKIGCWALTEPGAGSDALGISCAAARHGDDYILNGSKTFITNAPVADFFIVLARTGGERGRIQGGSAFILERSDPGLHTGRPMDKLGMRCSPTGEIFLQDCRVPKDRLLGPEGMAFFGMMASLDVERALTSFLGIGIARAAFDAALRYAAERSQFGRPIGKFQLIQAKLAEMHRDIQVTLGYALAVLHMAEAGQRITRQSAVSKWQASRAAVRAADHAVQILGGYGYIKEYPAERYLRDAKLMDIGAGTSEIMQLLIARELLARQ
jgi:alkylation response protein AidB-like acyl-CoA dehydrogenase